MGIERYELPYRILRYNHLCYMFSRNTKLVLSIFCLNKNDVTKWFDAKKCHLRNVG